MDIEITLFEWYNIIGRQLKMMREHRGMTQLDVANRIGSSQAYIAKLESGQGPVSLKRLYEIANILNCSIDLTFTPKLKL